MSKTFRSRFAVLMLAAAAAFSVGLPMVANSAAMSNYFQNKFVDWFLRAQTFTAPATVYVALDTTSGSASSCGTEVSGGSYARVAVTSSLSNWAGTQSAGSTSTSSGTTGQTSNNATITFPAPTANWGTVVGFCVMDASTGGNLLFYAPLTTSKTVNSGDSAPSFAISALTYTISYNAAPQFRHFGLDAANDADFDARTAA